MPSAKVAIFHNFLDNIGGAERVTLTLARELGADIYTTNVDSTRVALMGFSGIPIYSIGRVPRNAPLRQQLALHRFSRLNLGRRYQAYIICGDWAVSGAVHNHPVLWYVHSPIREIWDLYEHTKYRSVPALLHPAFDAWVAYNRRLTTRYAVAADAIACNSENTRRRIHRYLKRDATVIHPPVDTKKFFYRRNGDFWLSVNRLIDHKRVILQVAAFRQLPDERLIIVGSYESSRHFVRYVNAVMHSLPKNVEIRSWVPEQELVSLYADCRGFITTAEDEDFGLTAIEAMAAGKPVIAPDEGGYRETVIDGATGALIADITPARLAAVIKTIGAQPEQYRTACQAQAARYDTKKFVDSIAKHLERL